MALSPEKALAEAGFPVYLHGFSAIDSYLGRSSTVAVQVLCGAGLADLARLFDALRYPGADLADAAVDLGGKTWYFRCEDIAVQRWPDDTPDCPKWPDIASFGFLEFYQSCTTRRFYDPRGLYPYLRFLRDGVKSLSTAFLSELPQLSDAVRWMGTASANGRNSWYTIIDAAMILARYFPDTSNKKITTIAGTMSEQLHSLKSSPLVGTEEQRLALTGLLETANPAPGFELLKHCGFIGAHWPELAALDDVDHSKEYHPEGNVWKHTMEALRYRKGGMRGQTAFDLRLSLGLLLHDVGKPLAETAGNRRFDGHAELGERQARRFLERLGFASTLVHDTCYLVRNHMLPAALPRLPLFRTGEIMASPLFPVLLELYRCDESSSFKGLDGYYQSSAAYKAYLKHRRNPYRSPDGKKLKREQMMDLKI